jgi:hypothetical protein
MRKNKDKIFHFVFLAFLRKLSSNEYGNIKTDNKFAR